MTRFATLFFACVLLAMPAKALGASGALALLVTTGHPTGVSHAVCRLDGAGALVELRFQTESLLEVFPDIDLDRDGRLSSLELSQAKEQVEGYLLSNWQVLPAPFGPEDRLSGRLTHLGFPEALLASGQALAWIDAHLELKGESVLEDVIVRCLLFKEQDPYHRNFLTLSFADAAEWSALFSADHHEERFLAGHLRSTGVRREFYRAGLLLGQWPYALGLFVLTLVVAASGLRRVLGGLALILLGVAVAGISAALGGHLDERWIALAMPLALAYIGAENLLRRRTRTPWVEAPLFGFLLFLTIAALHGASIRAEPLASQAVLALAGAALSIGATAALLGILGARLLSGKSTDPAGESSAAQRFGLAPRWLFLLVSACSLAIGLGAFFLRATRF